MHTYPCLKAVVLHPWMPTGVTVGAFSFLEKQREIELLATGSLLKCL